MIRVLRYLFFLLVIRPLALIVLGLNVRRHELLPQTGPALVVSNHNSHLDALVLMTLFGMKRLHLVNPVAAVDYFLRDQPRLRHRLLGWFALNIVGIIPLERSMKGVRSDPLAGISEALEEGRVLILFPEGTRGEPEHLEDFKTGVAHVAKRHPEVPVVPVFMHGLGKALPKGEGLLVPFICDVFVGESFCWTGSRDSFMQELSERFAGLAEEGHFDEWE